MPDLAGYVAGPGEGVAGGSPDVKATAAATAGALTVMESVVRQGPPRHVHAHEDECFYVLEGTVTGTCGDEAFEAGPRSFVFLPRGLAHTFRAAEGEARGPGAADRRPRRHRALLRRDQQRRQRRRTGADRHQVRNPGRVSGPAPPGPAARAAAARPPPPVTCPPATFLGHYHPAKACGQTETGNSPTIPTAPAALFLIGWHAAPTGEIWALRRAALPSSIAR